MCHHLSDLLDGDSRGSKLGQMAEKLEKISADIHRAHSPTSSVSSTSTLPYLSTTSSSSSSSTLYEKIECKIPVMLSSEESLRVKEIVSRAVLYRANEAHIISHRLEVEGSKCFLILTPPCSGEMVLDLTVGGKECKDSPLALKVRPLALEEVKVEERMRKSINFIFI